MDLGMALSAARARVDRGPNPNGSHLYVRGRRACRRSAGFQPTVSPTSSRQGLLNDEHGCGLEIRDTAGWKPALRLHHGVRVWNVQAGGWPSAARAFAPAAIAGLGFSHCEESRGPRE